MGNPGPIKARFEQPSRPYVRLDSGSAAMYGHTDTFGGKRAFPAGKFEPRDRAGGYPQGFREGLGPGPLSPERSLPHRGRLRDLMSPHRAKAQRAAHSPEQFVVCACRLSRRNVVCTWAFLALTYFVFYDLPIIQ